LSGRLKESASCLVSEETDPGAHMERLMARLGKAGQLPPTKRILELNPHHPTVEAINTLFENNKEDPRLPMYCQLLHDEALIGEGSKIIDPAGFAKRINEVLLRDAKS
ncbi:MAG: molecular chaperone HtpG, partial [Bdellovibrionales bacterium]